MNMLYGRKLKLKSPCFKEEMQIKYIFDEHSEVPISESHFYVHYKTLIYPTKLCSVNRGVRVKRMSLDIFLEKHSVASSL